MKCLSHLRLRPDVEALGVEACAGQLKTQKLNTQNSGVEAERDAVVRSRHDLFAPVGVVEIPPDRGAQTRVEIVDGFPPELGSDAVGVDGVAEVVARAVGHELDQVSAAAARGRRP